MASDIQWTPTQAWDHLVSNVLQSPNTLNAFAYAVGCEDIDDFMYLGQTDFKTPFEVSTKDDQGNDTTVTQMLSSVTVNKLLRAQQWYDAQMIRDYSTWSYLTINVLNGFRNGTPSTTPTSPGTIPVTPMTSTTPIPINYGTTKQESYVTSFAKSIKRSTEDYPAFQEAKNWFSWSRRVKTKAAAHGCENVLDRYYVPDHETSPLFREHQKFLYDTFADKVQTQRGRQIVRLHESNLDAQKVWGDLCDE
jgi:hypothetical protein